VPPLFMTDGGGEYVMKLARSTKGKMSLALRQLVETQINTNFVGVHEPLVVQWFPVALVRVWGEGGIVLLCDRISGFFIGFTRGVASSWERRVIGVIGNEAVCPERCIRKTWRLTMRKIAHGVKLGSNSVCMRRKFQARH
jgi:hypothetical protein